jgi:hypothetical protein
LAVTLNPDRLRATTLITLLAGAGGSVGLMLRAGRGTPRFLLVLFVGWVLMPFVALAWANARSHTWSPLTRVTLYGVTLVITIVAWTVFGGVVMPPTGSPRAGPFVIVPPASLLLIAIALPLAGLISRRRSGGGPTA